MEPTFSISMMTMVPRMAGSVICHISLQRPAPSIPVSYTHLDVYKRQGIIPPEKPVILTAHRETHCLQLPSVAGEHGQIFRPFINKAFEFIQFIFFTPRRRIDV